ncbi:hypothetical protein N0V85_009016, partial [Neurospora sp. IMI 360204]
VLWTAIGNVILRALNIVLEELKTIMGSELHLNEEVLNLLGDHISGWYRTKIMSQQVAASMK